MPKANEYVKILLTNNTNNNVGLLLLGLPPLILFKESP